MSQNAHPSRPSLRKLVGAVALIAFVAVYALLIMVAATTVLPGRGGGAQLAFYAITGLAWVPVAAWLISWMHRPGG